MRFALGALLQGRANFFMGDTFIFTKVKRPALTGGACWALAGQQHLHLLLYLVGRSETFLMWFIDFAKQTSQIRRAKLSPVRASIINHRIHI